MESLHLLLLLQARLLPDGTGSMPADDLLPAGMVPARRKASSVLHAVCAGMSHVQGSVHDLHDGSGMPHTEGSLYGLPYGTAVLPQDGPVHDLHNG
jgi:hypothetical protein